MRFTVIGLGSMGKRRVRCLKRHGFETILGYDPRSDRRREAQEKYGVATTGDLDAAIAAPADAWIISTPPDTHVAYGLKAAERGIAFFTEASVTDPRADELIARLDATGVVGAPSCTMRYYLGPQMIKALIRENRIGRPLTFTYHCGQYLPDWHPWESYKDFYVSKRETGACREIVPFELAWLVDVFGPVSGLTCLKDRVGELDADIDDVYQLLMRFAGGLIGHLAVDVVARPAVRGFRVCGTEGTIEWDHTLNQVRVFRAGATTDQGSWETIELGRGVVESGYIHAEEPYIAEIGDFIAAVRGERPWPYNHRDSQAVLDLLVRAETSDGENRRAEQQP